MAVPEAEVTQVPRSQLLTPLDNYEFAGDNATVQRKCSFLRAFQEQGSILHAAQVCRINRKTIYRWIEADEQFAEAVADCKEDNYDELETSVYQRAFKSDLLAMFYLKAHRPKFRDKIQVNVNEIQEHIDTLISKLNQRQLPASLTEFIDTNYSQQSNEYVVSESDTAELELDERGQISSDSDTSQKPECSTCNIRNSE